MGSSRRIRLALVGLVVLVLVGWFVQATLDDGADEPRGGHTEQPAGALFHR